MVFNPKLRQKKMQTPKKGSKKTMCFEIKWFERARRKKWYMCVSGAVANANAQKTDLRRQYF